MISVVTPTVPGREDLLYECMASVRPLPHLIGLDRRREGPAVVRNRLIKQVITPWTLFLDDDDLLLPNYVDAVTPHLKGADVVYTSWLLSGADEPLPHPWDPELLLTRNFIPVTACVRTSALRAVGGFPQAREEDWALWLALQAAGARFTYVPVIAWRYRRRIGGRNLAPANPD